MTRCSKRKVVSKRRYKKSYKNKIKGTLDRALSEHPRTFSIRFDLRFPKPVTDEDSNKVIWYQINNDRGVISRFFDSFKEMVKGDMSRRIKSGTRVHKTSVRYVWAREKDTSVNVHYHVHVFVNRDTYFKFVNSETSNPALRSFAIRAWASALGIEPDIAVPLVYVPDNPTCSLNKNDPTHIFEEQYNTLLNRIYYLAKEETKYTEDGGRSFGCSSK